MNQDHVLEVLSAYLEGDLDAVGKERVDLHLGECLPCRSALADLRGIVHDAADLADRPPPRDLWPSIRQKLQPQPLVLLDGGGGRAATASRSPLTWSLPQAAAAGVAIAFLSGALAWTARGADFAPAPQSIVTEAPAPAASFAGSGIRPELASELTALELVLSERRDELEPATVRVLEKNLQLIDRAIEESLSALRSDPGNGFLEGHLESSVERKAEMLRGAVVLLGRASA